MKILVIGGGGREHAIIRKLRESPLVSEIHAAPGNGGIAADAVCVPISATDISAVCDYAREQSFDFAVVAPDDPLCMGMVDELESLGIPCFGPRANAAIIEGSKVFSKELMAKYNIPTASCEVFTDMGRALSYLETAPIPTVVKADGLALGKGVTVAMTREEAKAAVRAAMGDKVFGESGARIIIEEYLEGPEVSVLSFTDGKTLVPMLSSMDHKRALDGDEGPNTGGMGTIAPNPYYTPELAEQCMREIFLPTMFAMREEGRPFSGCLYFGLMLTKNGPKVIEYNCRFGDPETQVVLPLLETDLMEIMLAISKGELEDLPVRWKNESACCVILASGGYPSAYRKGLAISGLDCGQLPGGGATVYHAGTRLTEDGGLVTSGGRVLGVTATAPDLQQAIERAYTAADKLSFDSVHRRSDIGRRALAAEMEA